MLRVDEENEPAKNLQNFAKFCHFADPNPLTNVGAFHVEKIADRTLEPWATDDAVRSLMNAWPREPISSWQERDRL